MNKEYLGDSVYVEIQDGMFKLTTNNGLPEDPRNVIYMEPEVYIAFKRYASRALEGEGHPAALERQPEEKK